MESLDLIRLSLENFVSQLVAFLPKLIIALVIWYIGKYLLGLSLSLIKKIEVKDTEKDEKAISLLGAIVDICGRIVLLLVILDFLGIGRNLVSILLQNVGLALAIAFGISFGKALEEDAKHLLHSLKVLFRS